MSDRPGKAGRDRNNKKRKKKKKKVACGGEPNRSRSGAEPSPLGPKPSPSPLPFLVRAPLQALLESLAGLIKRVRMLNQEGPCQSCDESNPLPPLSEYHKAAGYVSDHITKLAALFSSPPTLPSPITVTSLGCTVEQTAANLVVAYHHINPIYGLALNKEVEKCTLDILRGMENVVSTIISTGTISVPRGLRNAGALWEFCTKAGKLSKDNKAAVVKDVLSQLHLVRDGCREAEQIALVNGREEEWGGGSEEGVGGGGVGREGCEDGEIGDLCEGVEEVKLGEEERREGPREWNDREKQLTEPCIELIKLCSEILGELCRAMVMGGRSGVEEGQAREMDQTLFLVLELSPLVDELVSELPAPLLWPDCWEAGERLASAIARLLQTIRLFHFCQESEKWTELHKHYYSLLSSLADRIAVCEATPQPHPTDCHFETF